MEEQLQRPGTLEARQSSEGPMRAHRGGVILALGIIGLVLCVICGIIAWVMGNNDLREMNAGRMDPSGRGLTKAGKICGMISVLLMLLWLMICLLSFAFFGSIRVRATG